MLKYSGSAQFVFPKFESAMSLADRVDHYVAISAEVRDQIRDACSVSQHLFSYDGMPNGVIQHIYVVVRPLGEMINRSIPTTCFEAQSLPVGRAEELLPAVLHYFVQLVS